MKRNPHCLKVLGTLMNVKHHLKMYQNNTLNIRVNPERIQQEEGLPIRAVPDGVSMEDFIQKGE